MTTKEVIAVMQAFEEGRQIQSRYNGGRFNVNQPDFMPGPWRDDKTEPGGWTLFDYDYRVKPEPMVLFVNLRKNGSFNTFTEEIGAASNRKMFPNEITGTLRLVEDLTYQPHDYGKSAMIEKVAKLKGLKVTRVTAADNPQFIPTTKKPVSKKNTKRK